MLFFEQLNECPDEVWAGGGTGLPSFIPAYIGFDENRVTFAWKDIFGSAQEPDRSGNLPS
jgi:hypothetical protein